MGNVCVCASLCVGSTVSLARRSPHADDHVLALHPVALGRQSHHRPHVHFLLSCVLQLLLAPTAPPVAAVVAVAAATAGVAVSLPSKQRRPAAIPLRITVIAAIVVAIVIATTTPPVVAKLLSNTATVVVVAAAAVETAAALLLGMGLRHRLLFSGLSAQPALLAVPPLQHVHFGGANLLSTK